MNGKIFAKPRVISNCLVLLSTLLLGPKPGCAASSSYASERSPSYTLTMQYKAMTANAGGQDSYALRLARNDEWELSAFSNQYLFTGTVPLSGLSYGWRFPVCRHPCILRSFVQLGIGASTAGPLLEVIWNLSPFWIFRIDVVTHAYFSKVRPIIWSYPLWLGLSVPF